MVGIRPIYPVDVGYMQLDSLVEADRKLRLHCLAEAGCLAEVDCLVEVDCMEALGTDMGSRGPIHRGRVHRVRCDARG